MCQLLRYVVEQGKLTVNVYGRQDDGMEGSYGREEQYRSQTGVSEPFRFSSKNAGCYEDVVSMIETRRVKK